MFPSIAIANTRTARWSMLLAITIIGHSSTAQPDRSADDFLARTKLKLERLDLLAAIDDCDSALVVYRAIGDSTRVEGVEQILGECYSAAGEYVQASIHLEHALTLATRTEDISKQASVLLALGMMHYSQHQFERAWEYLRASMALDRQLQDSIAIGRTYDRMAVLSGEDGAPNGTRRAIAYGDTALRIARIVHDSAGMASAHINLALNVKHAGDLDGSRAHTDSALVLARILGDSALIVHTLENLGQIAYTEGRTEEACAYCEVMLRYAQLHGMVKLERDATRCLMDANYIAGNWEQAFIALDRWLKLDTTVKNISSREAILKRSLVQSAQRREEALELAHKAQEQEQAARFWRWIYLLVGLVIAVVLFVFLYRRRRERDKARLENQLLRSRIDRHFLGNAMASIGNFVLESEPVVAYKLLVKYERHMRYVLEYTGKQEVSLERELVALREYLELEQELSLMKFDFTIHVPSEVDPKTVTIEPMFIQPYVENAVKHGVKPKEGPGHIDISLMLEGPYLKADIVDNGVGFKGYQEGTAHHSLGTQVTRERLIHSRGGRGLFGRERYVDAPVGVHVTLEIPYKQVLDRS